MNEDTQNQGNGFEHLSLKVSTCLSMIRSEKAMNAK